MTRRPEECEILAGRLPAEEGQCPECGNWFPIEFKHDPPPGGFWWAGRHSGCPGCGEMVCVESECEFRTAAEGRACRVADHLGWYRFRFSREAELQVGIATALSRLDTVLVRREFRLSDSDVIDFLVDDVGVEVKVDGSCPALLRQLHRYAQSDAIGSLVVATHLSRLAQMPATIGGKPVFVALLRGGIL